jgi:CNT family concentrative nucleoside transporter
MGRFTGVIGIVVLLGLAFVFSANRRAIRPRTVVTGLGLQILFAFLVLKFEYGRRTLTVAGEAVNRLLGYSFAGSQFVFGELGVKHSKYGFDFAFQESA